MSAGVEDGGGEGASAAGHRRWRAVLGGNAVERREQAEERPVDLVGLVLDDELGEREVELGWELGGERGGDLAE